MSLSSLPPRTAWRAHSGLGLALALGLALRLALWGHLPRTGWISDEGEYFSAASWLAAGRNFGWYLGYLWTRAPLYPLFVAAHLRLFGETPTPVFASQMVLSLLNVVLVYALARCLVPANRQAATLAAVLMALYFPFAIYPQALLSETLFIALLLGAFLALAYAVTTADRRPTANAGKRLRHGAWLVVAGGLMGLATLTRSITLAFLPVVALWLLLQPRTADDQQPTTRAAIRPFLAAMPPWFNPIVFLLAATLVIAPWTWYNSRLYGGLVVIDTSGAFNLMLGGRTAYDGNARLDAPSRNFGLALLDTKLDASQRRALLQPILAADGSVLSDGPCLARSGDPRFAAALARPDRTALPQAQVQQLMSAEGWCLTRAKPLAFARKSLAELVDLFQINYSGDERFTDNFTAGRLPQPYTLGLFLLDDTLYVLALPLAALGWALMRRARAKRSGANLQSLIGLWLLYNLAVAPLLFAINRFRLPLMPFVFLLAAQALVAAPHEWRALRSRSGVAWGALALALGLLAATPYAYLLPLNERGESPWASYLGPYPSSFEDTAMALAARPAYLHSEQLRAALRTGDAAAARALLASGPLTPDAARFGPPLLQALDGQAATAAAQFDPPALEAANDAKGAVIAADLLRTSGNAAAARALFSKQFVDNANPVQFAWDWLHPAPIPGNTLDIAGNLDLGYLRGCYLGEGDPLAGGNFRWCSDGAQIRFPQAGTGTPQRLVLRADGRGWAGYAAAPPLVEIWMNNQLVGTFTPVLHAPAEFAVPLPPNPSGADVVLTLHTPTFVPAAARYLSQQGSQVGQVQQLGVRLDTVRLEAAP
jgi:hypothetical protein